MAKIHDDTVSNEYRYYESNQELWLCTDVLFATAKHIQGIIAQSIILRVSNSAIRPPHLASYCASRAVKVTAVRPHHANGGGSGSLGGPSTCPFPPGRGAREGFVR
eukprot:6190594-Pleurochrysis_carterae.AAC.2